MPQVIYWLVGFFVLELWVYQEVELLLFSPDEITLSMISQFPAYVIYQLLQDITFRSFHLPPPLHVIVILQ